MEGDLLETANVVFGLTASKRRASRSSFIESFSLLPVSHELY